MDTGGIFNLNKKDRWLKLFDTFGERSLDLFKYQFLWWALFLKNPKDCKNTKMFITHLIRKNRFKDLQNL